MAVPEHEAAAGVGGTRPDMMNHRVWEVEAGVTRELQAEIEVKVFHVGKEIFVETADSFIGGSRVNACGGAGRKDMFLVGVGLAEWFGVVATPGKTAGMVDVPLAVQGLRVCGLDEPGGKEVAGMVKAGLMDIFKPVRFWEGIRVEQDDIVAFGVLGSEVVAAGEAEILIGAQDSQSYRRKSFCEVRGNWLIRAVV